MRFDCEAEMLSRCEADMKCMEMFSGQVPWFCPAVMLVAGGADIAKRKVHLNKSPIQ